MHFRGRQWHRDLVKVPPSDDGAQRDEPRQCARHDVLLIDTLSGTTLASQIAIPFLGSQRDGVEWRGWPRGRAVNSNVVWDSSVAYRTGREARSLDSPKTSNDGPTLVTKPTGKCHADGISWTTLFQ